MSNLQNSFKIIFFLIILLLIACGCQDKNNATRKGDLIILSSTTIINDVVANIAGDKAINQSLLPIGANPHSFEPTPSDVRKTADADIIFINGLGLEGFIDDLIRNSGTDARVISLSRSKTHKQHSNHAEHTHGADPHVWMDPHHVMNWTNIISANLAEIDSSNADFYKTNAQHYHAKLFDLDNWIREKVKDIDKRNRKLVTDHLVFNYFCIRYDFQQTGAVIPGYSSLAEPSVQELASLHDLIIRENIPAIFVSHNVNPVIATRLAEDIDIPVVKIYTASLSAGAEANTYIKYMRYNLEKIIKALNK